MTANVCVNDIENLFMKRNSGNKGWNVNETLVFFCCFTGNLPGISGKLVLFSYWNFSACFHKGFS